MRTRISNLFQGDAKSGDGTAVPMKCLDVEYSCGQCWFDSFLPVDME